jgi:hypothetical protein
VERPDEWSSLGADATELAECRNAREIYRGRVAVAVVVEGAGEFEESYPVATVDDVSFFSKVLRRGFLRRQ